MTKDKQKDKVPFFARFVETQQFPQVKTDVKAGPRPPGKGPPFHTLKYPSDDDEDGVPL